MKNAIRFSLVAALLCLAAGINAYAGIEETSFGLKNGSLIESLWFKRAWLKEQPAEDAIVLPTDTVLPNSRVSTTAVCLYTKGGKVLVHFDGGTYPVDALKPADLINFQDPQLKHVREVVAAIKLPAARPSPGDDMNRAAKVLTDPVMGAFAADIGEFKTLGGAMGKFLVFDWNYDHYLYSPDFACYKVSPPVNGVTGQPYLCVGGADAVEAVVFAYEYTKRFPAEATQMITGPYGVSAGATYMLYAKGKEVFVHHPYLGDANILEWGVLPDGAELKVADGTIVGVDKIFQRLRKYVFTNELMLAHQQRLGPTNGDARKLLLALPSKIPDQLPGDTERLQQIRVYRRLQALGVPSLWYKSDASYRHGGYTVQFQYSTKGFVYDGPKDACAGSFTPADRVRLPEPISGLIYAAQHNKDGQNTAVVIRDASAPGHTKAVCVRANRSNGKLYVHEPSVGDFPLEGLGAADLGDMAKRMAIYAAAKNKIDQEVDKQESANQSKALKEFEAKRLLKPNFDGSYAELSTVNVFRALQAAGIPCKVIPTRERSEDGVIHEYPAPALTFAWDGATFTYSFEQSCWTTDGFFPIKP
jgi:hypothetical protein